MEHSALRITPSTPLLLRRAQPRPVVREVTANMTVVTTQGSKPEMHDQRDDPTAPRKD